MSASVSSAFAPPSSPSASMPMPSPQQTNRSSPAPPSSQPPGGSQEESISKKRPLQDDDGDHEPQHGAENAAGSTTNEDSKNITDGSVADLDGKPLVNPNKKRRLTPAEKEEKEKEKARKEVERLEKETEKAEKKAALEEKKKAAEEAKRKKEEERRKKDEEKEEAKKKKDQEKRKKDEEKAKKERAQTRLSAFFGKPKYESTSPAAVSNSEYISENDSQATAEAPMVPLKAEKKKPLSDYDRYFQPFFVKQHVTVAPQNAFVRDAEYKAIIKKNIDETLNNSSTSPADSKGATIASVKGITGPEISDLFHIPHHKRQRRGKLPSHSVKQLLELINNSEAELSIGSSPPQGNKSPSYYLALLNKLPSKHFHFAEDIRPPYSGTFTRVPPPNTGLRKGRNPFERSLPNIDYDYDSEAEWIAPEEEDGEDLMSELGDEEDAEDAEDEEDMEEFLDDEEDRVKRMAGALCPLVPFSSGLCWEDERGRNERKELHDMKLEIILEGVSGPIDPFSNHYWLPPPKLPNTTLPAPSSSSNPVMSTFLSFTTNTALPHRPAQHTINTITVPQGPKKLIPPEDLEAFKKAVDGSDMTKAGLVELLKKQFPKASKDAIRETLGKVAVRIGGKEADKRWVLRES